MGLKTKIRWEELTARANRLGLGNALFFNLKLSRDFFRTDIPAEVFRFLKPPRIKERFFNLWINRRNILGPAAKIGSSYRWRHFVSSYLLSRNILTGLRVIYDKVFLPREEVAWHNHELSGQATYSAYLKRLLKPCQRLLQKS